MILKRPFKLLLLLALTVISGNVVAGPDGQQSARLTQSYAPYEPFAMKRKSPHRRVAPVQNTGQPNSTLKSCTYQGGPKSGLWSCR